MDPELLRGLASPGAAEVAAAAEALLRSSAPLAGAPPSELLEAVARAPAPARDALLELARAWERPAMSRAALDALSRAAGRGEREQLAWLLKTVLAAGHAPEAALRVRDAAGDAAVRRWLLEGLTRLAFGGEVGWDALGGLVPALAADAEPAVRGGLPALLAALPWRPESAALLRPLLLDPDAEVAAAAAHTLSGRPEAAREVEPHVLAHLREHPSALVRHCAAELDAALRQG